METIKGFIVYPTYRVRIVDNMEKAFVYLYGRLENGDSFLTINHFRPYFCIRANDREKAEKIIKADFEDTHLTNFDDEKITKVILWNPKDVPGTKQMLQDKGISCYEADIRFTYRFMIDLDLKGAMQIRGTHKPGKDYGENVDRVYEEAELSPTAFQPKLKILSMDIETTPTASEIFCISFYSENYKKVFIAKPGDYQHAESFQNEKEMLLRFKEMLIKLDPDIITGWNLIDFDLKVIKERMDHYKIDATLGRNRDYLKLRLSDNFFQDSKADIAGRAVLDGMHLMKMSFVKLEDYKLNTAAKNILGKEKIIQQSETWKDDIVKAFQKDPQHLIDYNLKDSELVYEIIEKEKLVELTVRRSMLTRMQPDRVNASVASFDSLYLKELQKRGYVAPTAAADEEADERIKGGFVRASKPGIYENIIIFDFKSLYPSIMRTFNIDPLDFVRKENLGKYNKGDLIEAPNGAHFRKRDGILAQLLQELWEQRDKAKRENNKLASNAIKILMNSLFGVLANPTCRFYSLEIANGITYFGQFLIKLCAEKMNAKGYDVIYGDTDSIFVNANEPDYKNAVKIGHTMQDELNAFFRQYVKENYDRVSVLELEFEKVYKKFMMPKVRGSEEGAKKRYVGIVENKGKDEMEFVGLEFVRRDWTGLAKKFQLELIEGIFRGEKIEGYVSDFVNDLKNGKYDDLLVYKKAIRKGVDEYTKTTPPHIKAARLMGRKNSGIIEYYMTEHGPEPVEMHKSKIDYQHYIDKQVKPIADSVLVFFGKSFDDLIKGHKQASLFDF